MNRRHNPPEGNEQHFINADCLVIKRRAKTAFIIVTFLGASVKFRKVTISSSCLSVYLHGRTRLALAGFL